MGLLAPSVVQPRAWPLPLLLRDKGSDAAFIDPVVDATGRVIERPCGVAEGAGLSPCIMVRQLVALWDACGGEMVTFAEQALECMACPISCETLVEPVTCADGYTYERSEITHWLAEHATSPMTNLPLSVVPVADNGVLLALLAELPAALAMAAGARAALGTVGASEAVSGAAGPSWARGAEGAGTDCFADAALPSAPTADPALLATWAAATSGGPSRPAPAALPSRPVTSLRLAAELGRAPRCVAASPSDIAVGCDDGTVLLLSPTDGTVRARHGHIGAVTSLAVLDDAAGVISGGEDGAVRQFYLGGWAGHLLFDAVHVGAVRAVASCGVDVVSGGRDGRIGIYRRDERRARRVLEMPFGGPLRALALTPSAIFGAGAKRAQARALSLSGARLGSYPSGTGDIVQLVADGAAVRSASEGGAIGSWDVRGRVLAAPVRPVGSARLDAFAMTPEMLIVGANRRLVATPRRPGAAVPACTLLEPGESIVALAACGPLVVAVSLTGRVWTWEP